MKFASIRLLTIALIFSLVVIPTASCQRLSRSEIQEKTDNFLSNVVGLDLTQYTVQPPPVYNFTLGSQLPNMTLPGFTYETPPQGYTFNYTSESHALNVESFFLGGKLGMLGIRPKTSPQIDYIYSGSPPTDTINQANSILENYQTFVSQEYSIDSSYIASMASVLKNAIAGTPKNETVGNIKFQIIQNGAYYDYDLKWNFYEYGISMDTWKRIEMRFKNNFLVDFQDTWTTYRVSGPNVLSAEEAHKTALAAVQNYAAVKYLDISIEFYDINLGMVPYRNGGFQRSIPRDLLTLYSLWDFYFYLHNSIGMRVDVWGDTGEVAYCDFSRTPESGFSNETDLALQPIPAAIPAATDNGTIVALSLNGNITAAQITNAAITANQTEGTTSISFNVTGTSGDIGFSNITIPKSLVSDGSTPIIQIDNQTAPNQGWIQDENNYFVWYITHFSCHTVTIAFGAAAQAENLPFSWWVAIPLVTVLALIATGFIVAIVRHKKVSR